jgi:hypothetical protein
MWVCVPVLDFLASFFVGIPIQVSYLNKVFGNTAVSIIAKEDTYPRQILNLSFRFTVTSHNILR